MPEMHVSSLIVQHAPDREAALRVALGAMAGLDWHAAQNGKAVITLVTDTEQEVMDRIAAINDLPGVHTTALVYHHCEDAESLAAEVPA